MAEKRLTDEGEPAQKDLVREGLYSNQAGVLAVSALKEKMSQYARKHTGGFFHYVRASRLKDMLEYGKVFLSRATAMNDKLEACQVDPLDYYICLNYGRDENVAMWGMYGKPRAESVRVQFEFKAVKALVKVLEARHAQKKAVAYLPNFASNGKVSCFEPIDASMVRFVEFHDVAYVGASESTIEHCRSFFKLDRKLTAKDKRGLSTYLKKRGWAYEHEVRLVIRLKKHLTNKDGSPADRIAIDFSPVFDAMKEKVGSVVIGPSYGGNPFDELSSALPPKCIRHSEYAGMIDFGDANEQGDPFKGTGKIVFQNCTFNIH